MQKTRVNTEDFSKKERKEQKSLQELEGGSDEVRISRFCGRSLEGRPEVAPRDLWSGSSWPGADLEPDY